MDDNSIMPYGRYKGDRMINVPAGYLLWLYENDKADKDVRDYITDNLPVLFQEVVNKNKLSYGRNN